jgi:hypothetical protein
LSNAFDRIDVAPSKSDHVVSWKKAEIDKNQNIDSVKHLAKANLDINRQRFRDGSKYAFQDIWMLLILLVIQLYFLFAKPKVAGKS